MEDGSSLSDLVGSALLFAQIGEFESARELALKARAEWRTEDSIPVTFDLMLVDGICLNYSGDLGSAFDRLNRASVLAKMMKDDHRIHLSQAWLAAVAFNSGKLIDAGRFLSNAALHLNGVGSNALFRSANVLSVLLQLCGNDLAVSRWVKFAQRAASAFGHPGLMSHLIYNISAARVSAGLLGRFFPELSRVNPELDSLSIDSSINFDFLSGVSVQSAFHLLIQAQSLTIESRFLAAREKLDSFLTTCQGVPHEFIVLAKFEQLYVKYQLEMPISNDDVSIVESRLSVLSSDDNLASACYILHLCFRRLSESENSDKYSSLALMYKSNHIQRCALILGFLGDSGLFDVPQAWWDTMRMS